MENQKIESAIKDLKLILDAYECAYEASCDNLPKESYAVGLFNGLISATHKAIKILEKNYE